VRSTAVVALAAHREDEDLIRFLQELLESDVPEEPIAVARALPRLPGAVAAQVATKALEHAQAPVASALALALAQEPSFSRDWSPTLLALLARREARPAARVALLKQGEVGLSALEKALEDPETDDAVRRHLPRSIHRFASRRAAEILVRNLGSARPDVRHKILRGLGRMRTDDPELPIPEEEIEREAEVALDRAIEMLGFRVACYAWSVLHGSRGEAAGLLGRLLADEEAQAMEQVFRALHVLDPRAEFDAIFEALRTGKAERAEGLELVRHLVGEDLRDGLLAMMSQAPDLVRLARACSHRENAPSCGLLEVLPSEPEEASEDWKTPELERTLADALRRLCADDDPVLSELARRAFPLSDTSTAAAEAQR
jgi:hypothetical protein